MKVLHLEISTQVLELCGVSRISTFFLKLLEKQI